MLQKSKSLLFSSSFSKINEYKLRSETVHWRSFQSKVASSTWENSSEYQNNAIFRFFFCCFCRVSGAVNVWIFYCVYVVWVTVVKGGFLFHWIFSFYLFQLSAAGWLFNINWLIKNNKQFCHEVSLSAFLGFRSMQNSFFQIAREEDKSPLCKHVVCSAH